MQVDEPIGMRIITAMTGDQLNHVKLVGGMADLREPF
jgi:hypothetical protein